MKRSFKFRIYPTVSQQEELLHIFNFCRFLYNAALQERREYYKKFGKGTNYVKQASYLKEIKQEFPKETENIYSQTLQGALKQLDSAFKNFFRRVKNGETPGYPRFKNKDRFRSIVFPQVVPDLSLSPVKIFGNKLKIYGICGDIKIIQHRKILGIAKNCRIIKELSDKWYIVISCDNVEKTNKREPTGKTCGVDLGLENFITLDDGTSFHHPKPYKTAKEKLAYQQRKFATKKKRSNNKNKQKILVAKTHEKITNIRKDFQHKLANKLIKENDVICVEKLNICQMLGPKNHIVKNINIIEASWGNFIQILKYKAESAGVLIKEINPKNTSKKCSGCGNIKETLELRERTYSCKICGLIIDRDQNAAINIRYAELKDLPSGTDGGRKYPKVLISVRE